MSYEFVYEAPTAPASGDTLLLLHGTGGNEHDLLPLGRVLAPGVGLLSPRGNVPERGMNRFFRRLAEGVFDFDDVRRRAGELASFVRHAAVTHGFDGGRVFAVGFSNGANIASATLLLHPGVIRSAVLFAPMLPLGPTPGPLPMQPDDVRVFLGAGEQDPFAPAADIARLESQLDGVGATVTVDWHPGGHQLVPNQIAAAAAWLAAARGT
jgi:predicted esterase